MEPKNLNTLSIAAHDAAVEKGFWKARPSLSHCQALIFSEVCEGIEADRKGRHADVELFDRRIAIGESECIGAFESHIKDTVEDELADTVIRILDLAGSLELDFTRVSATTYFRQFHKFDFPENAYGFIKGFCNENIPIIRRIVWAIAYIEGWAEYEDFDLWWHVGKKMEFNATRPVLHGKKY